MRPSHLTAIALLCLLCAREALAAGVSVADLVLARQFAINMPPAISRDGTWVAYTVIERTPTSVQAPTLAESRRTGVPYTALNGRVLVTSTVTGDTRTIAMDESSSWGPVWSPDGRVLAFLSDRHDAGEAAIARVWTWSLSTNQVRRLTSDGVSGAVEWTPDGRAVVVRLSSVADDVSVKTAPAPRKGSTATVFRGTAPATALALPSGTLADLALVSIDDGRVWRLVERDSVVASALSPDGHWLLATFARAPTRVGSLQRTYDVVKVHLRSLERVGLATSVALSGGDAARWSPDGSKIAYKTTDGIVIVDATGARVGEARHAFGAGIGADNRPPVWDADGRAVCYTTDNRVLWALDASTGRARTLADFGDSWVELVTQSSRALWQPAGEGSVGVYVHSFARGRSGFAAVSLADAQTKTLLDAERSLGSANVPFGMAVSPRDQGLVYLSESAHEPPDLWIADRQFESARRLTHVNPQLDAFAFGRSRTIQWTSGDGETLHGAVLLPSDYTPSRRLPLIVWVYGGASQSRDAHRFGLSRTPFFNQQLLATRGYAVLLPDAPQRKGEPVASLARSVLPGIDRAIEEGIADPDRIGLAGHSYGGYSTVALLTQSSRFKAAVASAGIYNLTSAYLVLSGDGSGRNLGLAEEGQMLMGAPLWDAADRFVANSPVFHLPRITAPLLLLHGADDESSRASESEQVFIGMRRLGKPVEYVRYEGEGHVISTLANQEDYWQRIIEWFDRFLKGSAP